MNPKTKAKPPLIIIGDSHTAALAGGARALGLDVEAVQYSGAKWHEGTFFYGRNGFECRGAPMGMNQIRDIRARHGINDILDLDRPVISTLGFHLGLLTRPLSWHEHMVLSDRSKESSNAQFVSRDFVQSYVHHFRDKHFQVAKKIAKRAKLVIVAPPPTLVGPNAGAVKEIILNAFQDMGVTVYDPALDFCDAEGKLDRHFLKEDGIHGNNDYGQKVIEKIIERDLL